MCPNLRKRQLRGEPSGDHGRPDDRDRQHAAEREDDDHSDTGGTRSAEATCEDGRVGEHVGE
jgi:hypothetical protein